MCRFTTGAGALQRLDPASSMSTDIHRLKQRDAWTSGRYFISNTQQRRSTLVLHPSKFTLRQLSSLRSQLSGPRRDLAPMARVAYDFHKNMIATLCHSAKYTREAVLLLRATQQTVNDDKVFVGRRSCVSDLPVQQRTKTGHQLQSRKIETFSSDRALP